MWLAEWQLRIFPGKTRCINITKSSKKNAELEQKSAARNQKICILLAVTLAKDAYTIPSKLEKVLTGVCMFRPYLNNNVITHHSNLSTTFQATIIKTIFFNSMAERKIRNFSKPFAKNNWFSWTFRYLQALTGISPMEYHNTIKTQATICLAQQVSTFKPWPSLLQHFLTWRNSIIQIKKKNVL